MHVSACAVFFLNLRFPIWWLSRSYRNSQYTQTPEGLLKTVEIMLIVTADLTDIFQVKYENICLIMREMRKEQ